MNSGITEGIVSGDITKVQIAPFGKWKGYNGDTEVIQNVDNVAFENIADELASEPREILVDLDHRSEQDTDRDTKAMAWASNISLGTDGIYADFKWTTDGAEAVKDRSYRFVSPTWILNEEGSPIKLLRIALTNRPNFKSLKPILNFEGKIMEEKQIDDNTVELKVEPITEPEVKPEESVNEPEVKPDVTEVTLDTVVAQLGLNPGAKLSDVSDAIKALQKIIADYAERDAEIELNAACDKVIEENKDVIKNSEQFKVIYKQNPDIAKAVLNTLCSKSEVAELKVLNAEHSELKVEPVTQLKVCNAEQAVKPIKVSLKAEMDKLQGADKLAFINKHASELQAEMSGVED